MCFLWLLGGVCGLFGLVSSVSLIGYTVGKLGAKGVAQRIPAAVRRELLERIDHAGAAAPATTLLHPDPAAGPAARSRVGGLPSLPAGTPWPGTERGAPARFLAQVELDTPLLPAVWQGRRISLFLGEEGATARSDAAPLPGTPAGTPAMAPAGVEVLPEVPLSPLRLPEGLETRRRRKQAPALDAARLLAAVPGLRERLAEYSTSPERVLPFLLSPGARAETLAATELVRVGGAPQLRREVAPSACPTCGSPRRFLLQLGDVFGPGRVLGHAGLLAVYGCDAHPEQVEARLDTP